MQINVNRDSQTQLWPRVTRRAGSIARNLISAQAKWPMKSVKLKLWWTRVKPAKTANAIEANCNFIQFYSIPQMLSSDLHIYIQTYISVYMEVTTLPLANICLWFIQEEL